MKEFASLYKNQPIKHSLLPKGIIFPVKYAIIRRMVNNNTFGMVRRNRNGTKRAHQGWDFHSPIGYRCYAISDGEVVSVVDRGAYGLQILIKFKYDFDGDGKKDTLYAHYAHLLSVEVEVGQKVRMGDVIGRTGDSGNAKGMRGTDAHLHFEIRTKRYVFRGLHGRLSPLAVFDNIPMKDIMVTDERLLK